MSLPKAGIYRSLLTELPNPRTRGIDLKPTLDVVRRINREDGQVAKAVGRQARNIAKAADAIASALKAGGKLVFVGAGTSGRLGVLEAAECPPTFGTPPGLVQAVMAGGRSSVFHSTEGAEDNMMDGARRTLKLVKKGDVVVGIAASGVTPFVRGALKAARWRKCLTILVTSSGLLPGTEADIVISPRVGPEVISGSTRLKSGTAAKLILNLLTTTAMIRLGKVYDHWMVDLKLTSRKLRLRGLRIISDLGRVGTPMAQRLMELSEGKVKVAVLAARLGEGTPKERVLRARRLLLLADGSLRLALDRIGPGR